MLHAFALAFRQLIDRALLKVLVKSLAITLAIFGALGVGVYVLLETMAEGYLGEQWRGLAAAAALVIALAALWLVFRAVAVAVVGLFGDEVVEAVERRNYPAALASARPVPFVRSARMGLRSAGRVIGYNLLAAPAYVALAVTGVGLPVAFFAMNGWLLGRDLGDMVAVRHLDPSQLDRWLAQTRGQRFLAGLVVTGLFVVPGLNLVAPVVGAAAMTNLFHRARSRTGGQAETI